jgi:hypothetical protein
MGHLFNHAKKIGFIGYLFNNPISMHVTLKFLIMKKLFMTLVLATLAQFAFSQKQVYVNGYYRSNGTYVQPHYRTSPNNTVYDNWSTYPNVNPYTGQTGTRIYNDSYFYTPSFNTSDFNRPNSLFQTNKLFKPNSLFN